MQIDVWNIAKKKKNTKTKTKTKTKDVQNMKMAATFMILQRFGKRRAQT